MRRGEVWWANMLPPVGRRPVLLLSRNAAYRSRTSVAVGIITRTIRHIPVEVPLGTEDGMPDTCAVNLDNIATIPRSLMAERVASLSADKMAQVAGAISFALDLEGLS